MENSLDSTSSEATLMGVKSVFKKPANFNMAFDISLNESTTGTNTKNLDFDSSSKFNTFRPFERQRKSNEMINVSAQESTLNSESEQSAAFVKPKSLFTKKPTVDLFNITFNESNSSPNVGTSCSEESALIKKVNLFRQNNDSDITIQVDENNQVSYAELDRENVDSTTFPTKPNPFRKSAKDVTDKLEVSMNNSVVSEKDESRIDTDSTSWMTKENPFGRRKSSQDTSNLSLTEQRTSTSTQRSKIGLTDKEADNLNMSVSQPCSELCVNESSINDENLNNWMSDQSEDELPPPEVPPVMRNLSPVTRNITPVTENQMNQSRSDKSFQKTNWEEKLNKIISKAQEKKVEQVVTPQKLKPKKTTPTESQEKRYRPKKLIKPASFATKGLYHFILKKFKPKYGVDAILEAEDMVSCICDTVKKVLRRKSHQRSLVQNLKKKMAKAELIETTVDFYEFVIKYLPYDFRVKVIPCLQPVSNTVYPPKDVANPFDKIL